MASQSGGAPSAKVVMLGAQSVGKTCLTIRLVDGKFSENEMTTIGAAYKQKKVSERVLDIWDTAGQESFASIITTYYRGIAGAAIIFDLTRKESFQRVDFWLNELKNKRENNQPISILLIESAILEIPSAALSNWPFSATSPKVTIKDLKSSSS